MVENNIIQVAIKLHKLPDEIEEMSAYWFNRMLIFMQAEAIASKLD